MPETDERRFKRLIEPHLDALFRAAYRLSRNVADAEDLVQETCVRAFVKLDDLHESQSVRGWLMRVQHNLFLDGSRRASSSPIDACGSGTDHAGASASPDPTPEESICAEQREAELQRAWLRLDRGHRALLTLRAEGYSLPEISEITSIAMDALTMRLYRARQALTRCLHELETRPIESKLEAVK